tara:strand:+ start:1079 stop:3391 length:2313 start_codon:yes stop_codon:yes gene_type:complete
MALDNKKIQEAKKLLSDIEKAYKAIGGVNPFKNIKAANSDLNDLKDGLADANTYLGLMDTKGSELVSSFKSINEEVTNTGSTYKDSLKSLNSLTSIAGKLRDSQQGINHLSSKQLSQLKSKAQSEQANLKINQNQLQSKLDNNTATDKEIGMLANINGLLNEKDSALEGIIASTQKEAKERKKVEKSLGVTGGILKGIGKIPILGDLIDTSQALDAAEKKGGGVKGFGAAIGSLGKQSISGLLNSSNLILGAFTMIGKTIMDMDKGAGAFAKDMNITYSEALKVREEMTTMAVASDDVGLSATKLLKTTSQVGNALGTNAQLNEKDLKIMTKLTNQAGFTADELMNIQKLSLANGKSLEANTKEILGGAKEYARRNKIAVNEKTILKEVNGMSASLKLSLGGSGDAMARAAVQAKKFGINLQQAESMAAGLLNFESSIQNELEAELLTGKNLNLEKARGLALNGDASAAAAEMLKQVGSSTDFTNMNVIAQEKMAAAVNMTREELAASLIEKEALNSIGHDSVEAAQKEYDTLRETMSAEEARKALGDDALAKQFEQQSSAELFAQSMERVKEIFVSIVDGPLGAMMSGIASILSNTGAAYTIFGGIAVLLGGKMLIGLGRMVGQLGIALGLSQAKAASEITAASALTMGIGTIAVMAAAAGAIGLMYAATKPKKVKDGVIDPKGGIVMSGEKGSIQLDKNDSVVAGTSLFGNEKTQGKSQGGGGGGSVNMAQTNALLQQLISVVQSGGTVTLDGQKVGEALKLSSFQTQ